MKKKLSIILCALIAGGALMSFAGCQTAVKPSEDVSVPEVTEIADSDGTADSPAKHTEEISVGEYDPKQINQGINVFSANVFTQEYGKHSGENVFLSPMSIYTALSMVSNGAESAAKSEITDVLSCYLKNNDVDNSADYSPVTVSELNSYFAGYMENLDAEKDTKMSMANSVWAMKNNGISVNKDFISTAENFYNADIFYEPANDGTVDKINNWVSKSTDKMINSILSPGSLNENSVSVLLNAIAFDGKWEKSYTENDVYTDDFHNYDGSVSEVEFMTSEETLYITDGYAEGIIKNYAGEDGEPRYAFMALIPKDSVSIDEYVENYFSYNTFKNCVDTYEVRSIYSCLPKFKFDTTYQVADTLKNMGITSAFDGGSADFSNFIESEQGNVFISDVIHKAYIELDEEGTKAAAVTGIIMEANGIDIAEELYEIIFDRPFIFAIYDYEEEIPVFIGALLDGENF